MARLIRPARPDDAQEISRVILAALRETNAKDYSEDVIARVELNFSAAAVSDFMARRLVFVAINDEAVIGTASLDGNVVRTVFIEPVWQRFGVGRALMAEVERVAVEQGVVTLVVPSSITAEPFYTKLGFFPVRDSYYEDERTIIMERPLPTSR